MQEYYVKAMFTNKVFITYCILNFSIVLFSLYSTVKPV